MQPPLVVFVALVQRKLGYHPDKNEYLKDIIDRINYERPPIVRITKENAKLYNESTEKGMKYHMEPYTITIELKAP